MLCMGDALLLIRTRCSFCDAGVMHVVVSLGAFLPGGLIQRASFDSHGWVRLILFRLVGVSHLEHQLS